LVGGWGLDFVYTLTNKNDKILTQLVKDIKRNLKKELLPKLKMFNDFKILFGKTTSKGLGLYIGGSYIWKPTMVLDLKNIMASADEYCVDDEVVITSTILHELGHAIQDTLHLPFNEDEAENFAEEYYKNKKIKLDFIKI